MTNQEMRQKLLELINILNTANMTGSDVYITTCTSKVSDNLSLHLSTKIKPEDTYEFVNLISDNFSRYEDD